jgi:light-regulated signal transduction histidine kinase (bacteriophytochrome)
MFAPRKLSSVLAVTAALIFFGIDLLMPRGATPAIGYTLVIVLAGGSRNRSFLVAITAACAVLTAVGYFLEPAGAAWWMSVFDRSTIVMVLWLAMFLVLRRLSLIVALAERTEALERATQELSRSNEELDRFASVVAHDLRGPLSGIKLVAQLLATRFRERVDPECSDWLAGIQAETDKMSQLIQRLLTYGHVGGGAVRLAACECESVLSAVLRSLSAELKKCDATVTHDPLPVVRADPILVSELFQNLMENAIKYRGDRPPHVHLSAVRQQSEWIISVRDNGVGISEADRQTVFRPFTQLKAMGRGNGVGLGLATCKRIVERHGGSIWAESRPGGGSTFSFTLAPAAIDASAN